MMCTLDEFEFRFLVHNVATVQFSTPWSLLIIKADLLFTEIKSGKITPRCTFKTKYAKYKGRTDYALMNNYWKPHFNLDSKPN